MVFTSLVSFATLSRFRPILIMLLLPLHDHFCLSFSVYMSFTGEIYYDLLNYSSEFCISFILVGNGGTCINTQIKGFVKWIDIPYCTREIGFSNLLIIYVEPSYAAGTKLFLTCLFKLEAKIQLDTSWECLLRSNIVTFTIIIVTKY